MLNNVPLILLRHNIELSGLLFLRNLSVATRTAISDRDDSEESSKDDSDSDNERLDDECRLKQRKISVELWDGVDKELVECLPDDIDGVKVYEMKGQLDKKKLVAALKDGRKWKKKLLHYLEWTCSCKVRGLQRIIQVH